MPNVEYEIENENDTRQEVPPVEGTRERKLNWFAATPVQDS